MLFKKFGNTYVLRMDKGEEIVSIITAFCVQEKIFLGSVIGIGATDKVAVGSFDAKNKCYRLAEEIVGEFEIVSLIGNISTLNGEPLAHLHAVLSDTNNNTFGGHLFSAMVSITCEVFINAIDGKIERGFDALTGANLLQE
ncbi:MAG: PPC domain-containing DNA-binding protein [Deltaproteobacteria bacterium]